MLGGRPATRGRECMVRSVVNTIWRRRVDPQAVLRFRVWHQNSRMVRLASRRAIFFVNFYIQSRGIYVRPLTIWEMPPESILMDSQLILWYLVLIIPAVAVGKELHERSHWAIGKWAGSNPVICRRYLIAKKVDQDFGTMEDHEIMFSGLAPFCWLLPTIILLSMIASGVELHFFQQYGIFHFLILPLVVYSWFFAVFTVTESDWVAINNPREFEDRWNNDEFSGDLLVAVFLLNVLSKDGIV